MAKRRDTAHEPLSRERVLEALRKTGGSARKRDIARELGIGAEQKKELRQILRSLEEVRRTVSDDVLVLPGHRMAFFGLHRRIQELADHHENRCQAILAACAKDALNGFELVPVVFGRTFGREVISSAIGEALAHANYLHDRGQLRRISRADGSVAFVASG